MDERVIKESTKKGRTNTGRRKRGEKEKERGGAGEGRGEEIRGAPKREGRKTEEETPSA